MISEDVVFSELDGHTALWCGKEGDNADLAMAADTAVAGGVDLISVVPDDVAAMWAWLEKTPVRIYARFYLAAGGGAREGVVSDLAAALNSAFKRGAVGAQIFMRPRDLVPFVRQIHAVRDDLFFNRDLSIGLDISDVGPFDWDDVFNALVDVRASALLLALTRDTGAASGFVGDVYAMLNAGVTAQFSGNLHFAMAAPYRAAQAVRLVESVWPDKIGGVRIFLN